MKENDFDNLDEEVNIDENVDLTDIIDIEDLAEEIDVNSSDIESIKNETDEIDELIDDDEDVMFKFNTNNHKIEGKHSLLRDTIFKGKLDDTSDQVDEYFNIHEDININDGLPIEAGSNYEFESKFNEDYINRQKLAKDVHKMLSEKTELDFSCNRRKPNRQAFNDYYKMLIDNIGKEYTKAEIFVELSYYFTDNIFNMFKLLNKEYATQIIIELKQAGYLDNLNNINFI
jgi:hypothetical protein